MDALDRRLINELQGGILVGERPFADVAARLNVNETEVIDRLGSLLQAGTLSRFGPLYDAEKLGGGLTLAALCVPAERFDGVTAIVNRFPEVAHNYARDHTLNMWFVVASERSERVPEVLAEIAAATGLEVVDLPKEQEFFLNLRLQA